MKERPKREGIMLAYPLDEGRLSRLGPEFIIQPKLNGERVIIEWFAEEPVLISSYGNERKFLDHITVALKDLHKIFGPIPLDGEVYRHGWSREEIDSALRRSVNRSSNSEGLEYHIFDVRSPDPCLQRLNFIKTLASSGYINAPDSPLKLVRSYLSNVSDWKVATNSFISEGYEGSILRRLDSPWQDKRTVNMLKFKPTEEDNYIVLDINEAIDKSGHPKGMVGSFVVKAPDVDETFKVSPGKMKHDERIYIWQHRTSYIGRTLTVKHEHLNTSGGVPLCAVAVSIA